MDQAPLSLRPQLAYPVLGCDQQLSQVMLLSLTADDVKITARPPLSLMLCVDLSGSMMGRPLELVIESIRMLLNQLNERDRLGMVTFANKGRLISPLRHLDAEGRGFFLGVLSGIQAAGSTHMQEGLELALREMPEESGGEIAHVVVLSDGKPNRGMTDLNGLCKLVQTQRDEFSLSCFGYGPKHDEDLMQALARRGGGGYAYIESEEVAPLAFAKELGSLFSMLGTHIQLLLRPMTGCSILNIRGEQTIRYTDRGVLIELPDMIAGQQIHLLLDVQLQTTSEVGTHGLVEVELGYTLPGQPPQEISTMQQVRYQTQHAPKLRQNDEVSKRILLSEVVVAWEEAHQLAAQKRFGPARECIEPYLERLQNHPSFKEEEGEVRNWYEQIIDEIHIFSQRPNEERYRQVRKAAKSEMADPTGMFRRSHTSIVELNTTQRHLLSRLMQKVFGVPHAHIVVESQPEDAHLEQTIFPILGETSIGRMAQIKLDHASVSKRHVRLVATPAGYLVIDLMSTEPPLVNGKKVEGPTLLEDGSLIQIAEFSLRFQMGLAPGLKNS